MGVSLIENPGNPPAFDSAGQNTSQHFTNLQMTVPCSAAVTANTIVSLSTNATTGITTCATGIIATSGSCFGVALDTTTAAGQLVRVVIYGLVLLNTGSVTFSAGGGFTSGAAGVPAAVGTIGLNVGIFTQATTASTPAYAFICHF